MVLMILTSVAWSQVENDFIPTMINYQGFLTDASGTALNGTYQITFSLYEDTTGIISLKWQEIHNSVIVDKGLFNVLLGSVDTLTADDLTGERYLGIEVGGEVEMMPRLRLASVAYSLNSENANNAQNAIYADSANYAQNAVYAVTANTANNALAIENFRFVSGLINANGTISSGNGFTSTYTTTGTYAITFVPAFSSPPTVIVTGVSSTAVDNWWIVGNITNSDVMVFSYDHTGTSHSLQDCAFNFIATGPR